MKTQTNQKASSMAPVNTTNDDLMVATGIRVPKLRINFGEFKHTPFEKEELRRRQNKYSPKLDHLRPDPSFPGKLIMYFKNEQKSNVFVTTETTICQERDVHSIVAEYVQAKKAPVTKVTFKGKTIKS